MAVPANLKFTANDEWIKVDGKNATVGITDYAQEQLSDIVFVEIVVAVGEVVNKGDSIATLESVKAAADVYTPVSGKVAKVNDGLGSSPEIINSDPYGAAWIIKIELTNPAELDTLMDAPAYDKFIQEQK